MDDGTTTDRDEKETGDGRGKEVWSFGNKDNPSVLSTKEGK